MEHPLHDKMRLCKNDFGLDYMTKMAAMPIAHYDKVTTPKNLLPIWKQ